METRGYAILGHMRDLTERVIQRLVMIVPNPDPQSYKQFKASKPLIPGKFSFLRRYYDLLEISVSHFGYGPDRNSRFLLRYYPLLVQIRAICKEQFNLTVLKNIDKIHMNEDRQLFAYRKAIMSHILPGVRRREYKDIY